MFDVKWLTTKDCSFIVKLSPKSEENDMDNKKSYLKTMVFSTSIKGCLIDSYYLFTLSWIIIIFHSSLNILIIVLVIIIRIMLVWKGMKREKMLFQTLNMTRYFFLLNFIKFYICLFSINNVAVIRRFISWCSHVTTW